MRFQKHVLLFAFSVICVLLATQIASAQEDLPPSAINSIPVTFDAPGPKIESPFGPRAANAAAPTVGYYDTAFGQGVSQQSAAITFLGYTPVQIFNLSAAELAGIDILLVQNPDNGSYGGEYLAHLADIQNAVNNGLVLIIHDRFVANAESILPGGGSFNIVRDFSDSSNIDVRDPLSVLVNGTAGTITNSTLDGGCSSSHGHALAASLPANAKLLLSKPTASNIVTFSYPFGSGHVVYSTIPLDFYLAPGTFCNAANFRGIYAPNVIEYANSLRLANCSTINYANFNSLAGIQLNGSAAQAGAVLRLTPAVGGLRGSAWHQTKQPVDQGFETKFDYNMNNGIADGLTFTIQNSPAGTAALGGDPSCGSCLGYTGITNSLSIQFDAYRNELRVASGGTLTPIALTTSIPDLNNGVTQTAKITYSPGTLRVFVDDLVNPRLTVPFNINTIGLDAGKAWVGFTGATGGGAENHDILNWSFTTVCQTNSAPTAIGDSYSIDEDTALNVPANGILGNDTDGDGDPLTASLVSGPAHALAFSLNSDGSFGYTPNANYYGPDSFTYKANDGQADSNTETVSITVNPVNDPPTLSNVPANAMIDELVVYAFTATAGDVDIPAQTLTFSLVGAPSGSSIDPSTGQFTWTPTEFQGDGSAYSFYVRVSDGVENSDLPITLTVNEVNSPPTLSNVPATATIDELVAYGFTATAGDSDNPVQSLTFSLVGAPAGSSINPMTGEFSWTPSEAQGNGSTYNFGVRVTDGVASTTASTAITVQEINSAPAVDPISDQAVDEETPLTVTVSAVDADDPQNSLVYSLDTTVNGMSINSATGDISWTPAENQGAGDYPVTVRVTDNGSPNLSATRSFNVHVNEVNVAPVLEAIGNQTIDEQVAFGFNAIANDADLPANGLTYSLIGAPSGAAITLGGTFSWTPSESQGPGSYTFTVKVTDDGTPNLSDEESITITVNEVNRPPVLDAISNQTGYWGNQYAFDANASDPDIPANTLTFSLIGAPAGASIDPATGFFAWTPNSGQIGSHTFTVRVADNGIPVLDDDQPVTISVGRRPTMLVYAGDGSEQYSDQQGLTAMLSDNGGGALQGSPISGRTVGFAIGSQNSDDLTDAGGLADTSMILTQDPAPSYSVASRFDGDTHYLPATDSDPFDIVQEDARTYYTGTLFVNTACATCSNGTATLSATIKDITAENSDPAYDGFAGDIRNSTVTFIDRDTNTPISGCSNLSVGLVNLADTKVGTATCNWNVNIGSADSLDYTVGIVVSNYYKRNSSIENTVVTVSKPIGTNFITGGGYLVNSLSNGQYSGLVNLKTNFGFNVKYNKSGTNLQGRINVIVRGSGGRTYQIKGTVMRTLSVRTLTNNPLVRVAVYTGKATMSDITDPLNPISLGGNNTFQMELTDKGEPGNTDTIAITVWNDAGGLLFSSRWDGTRSVEQLLGGGNLVIR